MTRLTEDGFDDLNEAVSRLAYWVAAADSRALLRITEGFGAAVAASASAAMRSSGERPETVALALAERAEAFQVGRDAQHCRMAAAFDRARASERATLVPST